MIQVELSLGALGDLERLEAFLHPDERRATEAVETIIEALRMLQRHPYVGRPVRGALRELVISFGRTGYVALYRVRRSGVEVMRIRHQLESGYGTSPHA